MKKEAPIKAEKKELSEAEKMQHQRAVINKLLNEGEQSLMKIIEEINEKGFNEYTYKPDSQVTIQGGMFAQLLNYLVAVRNHNENLRVLLGDIVDSMDTVTLGALDFQTILTQKHIENCENGSATKVSTESDVSVAKKAPSKKVAKK